MLLSNAQNNSHFFQYYNKIKKIIEFFEYNIMDSLKVDRNIFPESISDISIVHEDSEF